MGIGKISIMAPIIQNYHLENYLWGFFHLICTWDNFNFAIQVAFCVLLVSRKLGEVGM